MTREREREREGGREGGRGREREREREDIYKYNPIIIFMNFHEAHLYRSSVMAI